MLSIEVLEITLVQCNLTDNKNQLNLILIC